MAARLWNLRECYQSLIVDIQSEAISPDDARGRRELLQKEAVEIYADAPRTTATAYNLKVDNKAEIATRRDEIAKVLNK